MRNVGLPRQVDRQLQQSSNHYCVARCASARRVIAIMPSVSHPAHSLCRLELLTVVGGPVATAQAHARRHAANLAVSRRS
jgi:hypothetical protein